MTKVEGRGTRPATLLVTTQAAFVDELWAYTLPSKGNSAGRWQTLPSNGPSARASAAVYDAHDKLLLLSGGRAVSDLGDVWSYAVAGRNSGRWSQLDGGTIGARSGQASAWDSRDRVLFVFGGFSRTWLNDLWAYKPAQGATGRWSLIATPSSPAPRTEASLVWDSSDSVLLLFGGADQHGVHNDVWAYKPAGDGTATGAWTPLSVPLAPPARHFQAAAWDDKNRQMLIYGGQTTLAPLPDLWALRSITMSTGQASWVQLMGQAPLAPRYLPASAWDPGRARLLLFGGINDAGNFLNDFWAYSPSATGAGSWARLSSSGGPDGRSGAAVAWDSVDSAMLLFGGYGFKGHRNDSYAYLPSSGWRLLHPSNPPSRRYTASGAFDTVNNGFLIVGGADFNGQFNDLWQLGGRQPAPRKTAAGASHSSGKPPKKKK